MLLAFLSLAGTTGLRVGFSPYLGYGISLLTFPLTFIPKHHWELKFGFQFNPMSIEYIWQTRFTQLLEMENGSINN